MDIFKRDRIQVADFRRVIEDDMLFSNNATISGGKDLIGRSTFDWKLHARQQVGLYISKNYPEIQDSFSGMIELFDISDLKFNSYLHKWSHHIQELF